MRRAFSVLAMTACLFTGLPAATWADTSPGFILFGGPDRKHNLGFHLDYGTPDFNGDRYRLDIKNSDITAAVGGSVAINQIAIEYPDYYDGKFDPKSIEVHLKKNNKIVPLQPVDWNKDNHVINIYFQNPIPAGHSFYVELSNIHNPWNGGTYYFNCKIITPGDAPLLRYIGTWVLSINKE